MKFKESILKQYAAPLSETEDIKCKHAIEAIRDALSDLGYTDDQKGIRLLESDTLSYAVSMRNKYSTERVHMFIQVSYSNKTCVRNESDVDIAVVREDIFDYAWGASLELTTENKRKEAKALKDAAERVLKNRFPAQVHRGNKSIKVDGNTYRKQADTVPCISFHHYYRSHLNDYSTHRDGIVIFADDGTVIRNFPKQHIANGKAKNIRTNYYYKKMVRIIKKMRHLMSNYGYKSADGVSSFGLESLLWNIPDSYFTKYKSYGFVFQELLGHLHNNQYVLINGLEANGIKELCPTQNEVSAYTSFINDLYSFFEYDYT